MKMHTEVTLLYKYLLYDYFRERPLKREIQQPNTERIFEAK